MNPKQKLYIISAVCIMIAGLALMAFVSLAISNYSIGLSNHRWCNSLALITSNKVPPPSPGHTSQVTNYRLYLSFVELERQYKCDIIK